MAKRASAKRPVTRAVQKQGKAEAKPKAKAKAMAALISVDKPVAVACKFRKLFFEHAPCWQAHLSKPRHWSLYAAVSPGLACG